MSMDCPPGTLFDVTQNVCNFPYLTTCFSGQSGDSQKGNSDQLHFGQSGQYQGHQQGAYSGQHGYSQEHINQFGAQGQGGQAGNSI